MRITDRNSGLPPYLTPRQKFCPPAPRLLTAIPDGRAAQMSLRRVSRRPTRGWPVLGRAARCQRQMGLPRGCLAFWLLLPLDTILVLSGLVVLCVARVDLLGLLPFSLPLNSQKHEQTVPRGGT